MTSTPQQPQQRRRSSLVQLKDRVVAWERSVLRRLSHHKRASITTTTEEEAQLQHMLSQLTPEEVEMAARTNYEYFSRSDDEDLKIDSALRMCKRYLRSKKDPDLALTKLRATLAFRQEMDVDGLRLAFEEDKNSAYSEPLKEHLSSRMVHVMGYDKQGRATYIFETGKAAHHDAEWTIKQHMYTLERAIACSKAQDKTVNAVINFDGFSIRKAPPTHIGKQFMTTLRSHYVGNVNQIYLLDAPTAFWCLWKVVSPFVGSNTKDKIHFISGNRNKAKVLGELYDESQATPWMLPGGKKARELDLDEYLAAPFNTAFDE